MALWKPKKIIFIGSQNPLLKVLAKENETEVISSISFLESLSMRFLPDLIVAEMLSRDDIMQIRKTERFAFIPILITTEKFTEEEIKAVIPFPNILMCNSIISIHDDFIKHLKEIMAKSKSMLSAKTGAIVKKAVCYIDINMGKKFSRKEISQKTGTDEDYLTKVFRLEMGLGLWDYINILRLEEARNLLVYTGLSIKEIAERCGFTSDAYFCNCFRKHYKISPGDARNNKI